MSHLNEIGLTYFQHLVRAWKWAFMLIIHGLFPNIWKTKVSDQMCVSKEVDTATRKYLLKTMYGIKDRDEEDTPSIYSRLSDQQLVAKQLYSKRKK